jgi:2-polyprenyl-6-methoxyphenol hydroxylase-like FAD-dependent oxidoreductase
MVTIYLIENLSVGEKMKLETEVCIVGGGPGGALLAYILAKHNISTILLERNEGIDKEFRGEHLNEEGETILKKYGLYNEVEEKGLLLMKRVEYWDNGKLLKTILPHAGKKHVGIHVPQNHLLSGIYEGSKALKTYQSLLGTKVTDLIEDNTGTTIGVKAIRHGEEITIHSSVVVGADGRYSTVRKLANIPTTIIKHGYDLLWAKIPSPEGWEPSIKLALVDEKQLALFTQYGGFIQIGWGIEEDSYPILRNQSFKQFIDRIRLAFPELTATVNQHITACKDFVVLKVQSCRCETWVKEGLVIMGDAAHTMSPTGAIGVNSALKDADILSEVLISSLKNNDFSLRQLKEFENKRRAEVEKQQAEQLFREATFKENFQVI